MRKRQTMTATLAACALAAGLGLAGCFPQTGSADVADAASGSDTAQSVVEGSGTSATSSTSADSATSAELSASTTIPGEERWSSAEATDATGAASTDDERAQLRADAEARGLTVFEGTVRLMNGVELCELEGNDPEMFSGTDVLSESSYAILMLDGEQTVQGGYGDGSTGERTSDHVSLGQSLPYPGVEDTASVWEPYREMRVCVAGEPWLPTDVSLPLAPRMTMGEILYVVE